MSADGVLAKYADELMRLPNVVGVGIGAKAGKEVVKVFVSQKVPESALEPGGTVPRSLDGYDVDVEAIGIPAAQRRRGGDHDG